MASYSVDTNNSTLQAYVGIHRDELNQILKDGMVRPCNVMKESAERSYVELDTTILAAENRALRHGFEELGKEQKDKQHLVLMAFEFTALGLGHFMLTKKLAISDDWRKLLFYGNLPLRCTNIEDNFLVTGSVFEEDQWRCVRRTSGSCGGPVA